MKKIEESSQPNWPLLAGIRFALAIVIFNEHSRLVGGSPWLSSYLGGGAVAAFFVISGFSMAHSLSKGSKGFYERRFYRIWPLYIFSLFLALIPYLTGEGVFGWPEGGASEIPDKFQIICNALMLQPWVVWPLGTNGVTWSLGVEAAFYVVVPFYFKLSVKPRIGILLASLAFSFWVTTHSTIPLFNKGTYFPYVGMFWLFALGCELFRYREDRRVQQAALVSPMLAGAGAGLGCVTMAVSLLLVIHQSKIQITPKWQRILIYLGELSYPLYILHDPIMANVYKLAPKTPIGLYYVAGILGAIIAYHVIDAPLRGWQRKRQRQMGNPISQTPVMNNPLVLEK